VANLALYRKYRPRTFDEVIGQEHVTAPLIQALKNGKLNHAYLFSGPRGCGKTSSARILARSLNCVNGPTPNPCDQCESCVALAPDGSGSLDVIEIDAASHGGVDDARDLRERAFFAPVSSRFKIYVIDEAHMVSPAGFNALLKLVEEPPDFVKFIFATTEPEKVLQTIRSRTHHYPFRLVPPGALRGLLEENCRREGVTVESAVFPLIVRAGGGSVRDAQSVLDQLLSGAGPDGVTYATAVKLLGVTDAALLDEACDALAAADGAGVFATVDSVVEAGHDPRRFATDLLERLRDLLILEKVPDAVAKGLIDAPADQLERMTGQALRLGGASLSRMADIVHDGLIQMRGTTSPRLLLELVCARLLLPGADDSQGALLQRLERLERRFDITGQDGVPAVARPAEPVRAVEAPAARADAPARNADAPATNGAVRPAPAPTSPTTAPAAPTEPATSAAAPPAPAATSPAPAAAAAPPAATPALTKPAAPATSPAAEAPTPPPPTAPPAAAPAQAGPAQAGPAQAGPAQAGPAQAGPAQSAPAQPAPPATSSGPLAAPPEHTAGEVDAAAVRRLWPEILERVKKRRVVWSLMQNATPREVKGSELILAVQHQGLVRRFADEQVVKLLQEVLHEVLGVRWVIRAVADGAPTAPAPARPPEPAAPTKPPGDAAPSGDDWPEVRQVVRIPEPDGDPGPPPPPEYDGFDPGDEPADEVGPGDGPVVRRDTGAEAMALLEQELGARKIRDL
jgi:DNA polymerase-3 subunit gamma/tau